MTASSLSLQHTPVLLEEILKQLQVREGITIIDGTLGLGGHSTAFAKIIGSNGRLLGIDWDKRNLELAKKKLESYEHVQTAHGSFADMDRIATEYGLQKADALLLDLGLSSAHLDDPDRGFSFRFEAPLDLRMDTRRPETAADLLNQSREEDIADILWQYGEERSSRRIAKRIVERRKEKPLETTTELYAILESCYGFRAKKAAARIFQALRIAVNGELDAIRQGLLAAKKLIEDGGRIAIISFHSLEDRIIKRTFQAWEKEGQWKRVNKKVIKPSPEEQERNPRSRSAKLRIIEKLPT